MLVREIMLRVALWFGVFVMLVSGVETWRKNRRHFGEVPATARQLRRAQRRNRADLRKMLKGRR